MILLLNHSPIIFGNSYFNFNFKFPTKKSLNLILPPPNLFVFSLASQNQPAIPHPLFSASEFRLVFRRWSWIVFQDPASGCLFLQRFFAEHVSQSGKSGVVLFFVGNPIFCVGKNQTGYIILGGKFERKLAFLFFGGVGGGG